jgi:DNA-binding MarR family transcriptional regulator
VIADGDYPGRLATAGERAERVPEQRSEASGASGSPADLLHAFAVRLRRMNGEINRLVHGFAGDQGLHATDVQALAAILDADGPMTPTRLREHLGLTTRRSPRAWTAPERAGHIRRVRESADRRVVHLHYAEDDRSDARSAARAYFRPLAEATRAARARFTEDELSVVLRFVGAMGEDAFGVLLDTLVVRSPLVPALVRDVGARAWWPGRLGRDRDSAADAPSAGR